MSASIWLEITNGAGEVEAVCTLASFRAANAESFDDAQFTAIEALHPGDSLAFGGGASPDVEVTRCAEKRAAALDMIEAACAEHGTTFEVQVDDGSDPDNGALPFSIWFDDGIIGADTTLDRTIEDALRTVAVWAKNEAVGS